MCAGPYAADDELTIPHSGTGASAIYALLACRTLLNLTLQATEIDHRSFTYARRNIDNNGLSRRISLVRSELEDEIFGSCEGESVAPVSLPVGSTWALGQTSPCAILPSTLQPRRFVISRPKSPPILSQCVQRPTWKVLTLTPRFAQGQHRK